MEQIEQLVTTITEILEIHLQEFEPIQPVTIQTQQVTPLDKVEEDLIEEAIRPFNIFQQKQRRLAKEQAREAARIKHQRLIRIAEKSGIKDRQNRTSYGISC